MENCRVSVIVSVYNAQRYLRQCLDSILAQTLEDIEVLCVDDGSTDDSPAILEEYAAADPRIRILHQANRGAGAARNAGLKEASGEYLSFLDADDFFEPQMLACAWERAKEVDAQIVVFGSDQYRDDTGSFQDADWTIRRQALPPYRPMDYRTFTDNVFRVFVGWAWDKLFERRFVLSHGLRFQEQRTSNDLRFVFSAVVLAERIEVADMVLAHQRRDNPDSLSNTRERSWTCFYRALLALRADLVRYGLYRELEQDFVNYALHFALWNLNTLRGETQELLYRKLRGEWFRELGITGRSKGYFYDRGEYKKYRAIMHRRRDYLQ